MCSKCHTPHKTITKPGHSNTIPTRQEAVYYTLTSDHNKLTWYRAAVQYTGVWQFL